VANKELEKYYSRFGLNIKKWNPYKTMDIFCRFDSSGIPIEDITDEAINEFKTAFEMYLAHGSVKNYYFSQVKLKHDLLEDALASFTDDEFGFESATSFCKRNKLHEALDSMSVSGKKSDETIIEKLAFKQGSLLVNVMETYCSFLALGIQRLCVASVCDGRKYVGLHEFLSKEIDEREKLKRKPPAFLETHRVYCRRSTIKTESCI
jgi:hypothetical protein